MVTPNLYRCLPSRTNDYLSDLAACILAFSGCVMAYAFDSLTQSYPLNTRGKNSNHRTSRPGLYAFLKEVGTS